LFKAEDPQAPAKKRKTINVSILRDSAAPKENAINREEKR
jgi:hypothetical protein